MKLEDTYRIKGGLDETYAIKGNYLPRVEIKKFNGTLVRLWLNQLEQYFLLHQVPHDKRVNLTALHMGNKPFQWYQWVRRWKAVVIPYIWDNFVEDITAQYDNVWDQDYFSQLAKIRQMGTVMEYTLQHQELATRVEGLSDEKLLELYIGGF